MKYTTYLLSALLLVTLLSTDVNSRRVNVKQVADDVERDDAQQSAADDEAQQQQFKPVLITRRPLHQRPQVDVETERQPVVVIRQSPRVLQQRPREQQGVAAADDEDDEQQSQVIIRQQPTKAGLRAQSPQAQQLVQQRLKQQEQPQQKEPTAQTIRNFNKLNDDGSFTFGYEADDGSFKEETRGTDCVVRGKYGYVDPDGNKREFTYVQGNPCDPNASTAEDEEEQPGKPGEEENVPANIPANAGRPKPKNSNRPTTTLFQQTFGDFESQPQPSTTPRQPGRQQLQQQSAFQEPAPRRPPPPQISPVQLQADRPSSTAAPPPPPPQFLPAAGNLESAIRNLPQPALTSAGKVQTPAGPNSPLYTTELVFDPATGQYNTVIFQQVPKQQAGININQRLPLQPARQQPLPAQQFRPQAPPQFQQPQPQFRPALQPFQPQFQPQRPVEFDFQRPAAAAVGFPGAPGPQQQLVQQQQALAFQQSQNLFRQQQQKQQQQQPQFQPQSAQFFPPPSQRFEPAASQFAPKQPQRFEQQPEAQQQQFVLVQPGRTPGQQSLAAGQIDAFLRGHNVQF